jgi:hypothetical protein
MPTNFQTTYFGMHFIVTLFSIKRQEFSSILPAEKRFCQIAIKGKAYLIEHLAQNLLFKA